MRRFSPIPAPFTEELEIQNLADHTGEVQEEIENSLTTVHDLDVVNAAPEKPENGMLRYADGVAWDPGHGEGVYFYRNGEWVPMWVEVDDDSDIVSPGGTTMYLAAASTGYGNIDPTPSLITGYDALETPEEHAQGNIGNGTITFQETGFWLLGFLFAGTVAASSANTTREYGIRLYNVTDGTPLDDMGYGSIARYAENIGMTAVIRAGIPPSFVGKAFGVQIFSTSGDTINVQTLESLEFWVARVSNRAVYPGA